LGKSKDGNKSEREVTLNIGQRMKVVIVGRKTSNNKITARSWVSEEEKKSKRKRKCRYG
jgi:hypothetical protein